MCNNQGRYLFPAIKLQYNKIKYNHLVVYYILYMNDVVREWPASRQRRIWNPKRENTNWGECPPCVDGLQFWVISDATHAIFETFCTIFCRFTLDLATDRTTQEWKLFVIMLLSLS